jgi:hypothetical protein
MAIRGNFGYNDIATVSDVTPSNKPKYVEVAVPLQSVTVPLKYLMAEVRLANTNAGADIYTLIQYSTVSDGATTFMTYGIAQNIVDFPLINDQTLSLPG